MDTVVTQIVNSSNMEKFEKVQQRYAQFLDHVGDMNKTPVRVFEPLSKTCLEQLEIVREVSAHLQQKREEDTRAAEEAALAPETKTETDTNTEERSEETAQ